MEMIRISDSKIKVILLPGDMDRYVAENDDDGSPAERGTLRAILRDLREKTGFDVTGERVLVQMFPARDGGCELFVTRLGKLAGQKIEPRLPAPPDLPLRSAVFVFDRLPPLLRVCRHLSHIGYPHLSAVYAGDDDLWYLVLQERIPGARPSPLSFAEEFGTRRRAAVTLAYIKEHGTCISPSNAITLLSPLC